MPPKLKYTRETLLDAAIELVEEQGFETLNVRSVAERLGCSTQPVMSAFSSVEELHRAVYDQANSLFSAYVMAGTSPECPFDGMGKQYLSFSKEHPHLFRLLHLTPGFPKDLEREEEENAPFIAHFADNTGLSKEEAQRFFTAIQIFTHGMATLQATNSLRLSEEESLEHLTFAFNALLDKSIAESQWNQGN